MLLANQVFREFLLKTRLDTLCRVHTLLTQKRYKNQTQTQLFEETKHICTYRVDWISNEIQTKRYTLKGHLFVFINYFITQSTRVRQCGPKQRQNQNLLTFTDTVRDTTLYIIKTPTVGRKTQIFKKKNVFIRSKKHRVSVWFFTQLFSRAPNNKIFTDGFQTSSTSCGTTKRADTEAAETRKVRRCVEYCVAAVEAREAARKHNEARAAATATVAVVPVATVAAPTVQPCAIAAVASSIDRHL